MCGIAGILHRDPNHDIDMNIVKQMSKLLAHRGPDDHGEFNNHSIAFAHRRLAVIGLESGHQPMFNKNKTIVFNGEIYNYKHIKQNIKNTYNFTTESDTEVLLAISNFESTEWLNSIIGMFSFAIWDNAKNKLMLARDRYGKKPLYYYQSNEYIVFSSEIKPILEHPEINAEPNIDKYGEFLAFRSVAGNQTMFSNINEVPPGHILIIDQNKWEIKATQYWSDEPDFENYFRNTNDRSFLDQLDSVLHDSINYRLVSDVPIGTFNSGGVDSSILSFLSARKLSNKIHTFSVGFHESDYDESSYAPQVSNIINSKHHTLHVTQKDYLNNFEKTSWHLEEPLNHAHTVPIFLLSKLAKEYVTVVLTGEGADEIFGGYPRHQIPLLSALFNFLPRSVNYNMESIAIKFNLHRTAKLFGSMSSFENSAIQSLKYIPSQSHDCLLRHFDINKTREKLLTDCINSYNSNVNRILCYDRKVYLPSLLNRLDKITMAHGLEARAPFIDHRLAAWANKLPNRLRVTLGKDNKVILKKYALKLGLPKKAIYRRKVGFGVPLAHWFRDSKGFGQMLDLLTDKTFNERGLYDKSCINLLIKNHLLDKSDNTELLWSILSLELWHRQFIDKS